MGSKTTIVPRGIIIRNSCHGRLTPNALAIK
jgi:hypothetical protein